MEIYFYLNLHLYLFCTRDKSCSTLLSMCSQTLLYKLMYSLFSVLCSYGLRLYVPKNVGQNVFILLENSGQQSNLLLSFCNFSQMQSVELAACQQ